MKLTIKEKEYELKFTFNSFRFMEDFNFSELEEVQHKPFKLIGVTSQLLLGALNHNRDEYYSQDDVEELMENILEENSIAELLNDLVELLQESSFFKSLQKQTKKKKK